MSSHENENDPPAMDDYEDDSNSFIMLDMKHTWFYFGVILFNCLFGLAIYIYLSIASLFYLFLVALCLGLGVSSYFLFQKRHSILRFFMMLSVFGMLLSLLVIVDSWPFWITLIGMILNMATILVNYIDVRKQDRAALREMRLARKMYSQ